jgi:hypothetical protein
MTIFIIFPSCPTYLYNRKTSLDLNMILGTMLQAGWSRDRMSMRRIFANLPNPSGRSMALGSTQPLTEMHSRNLPVRKERPARRTDILTAICEPVI